MSRQLLQECIEFKPRNIINESSTVDSGYEPYVVEGVLQRKNAKNQNGRIYPSSILEREVKNYQEKIDQKRALGELDHPESNVVNLRNVSHNVLEVRWDGDDLIGKVEILDTPSGKILKELLKAGVTLGISSRGLGSVKNIDESTVEVQDDFELICWDFVSDPSTHGAFMNPVKENKLNENKEMKKLDVYHEIDSLITEIICDISGECCLKNGMENE